MPITMFREVLSKANIRVVRVDIESLCLGFSDNSTQRLFIRDMCLNTGPAPFVRGIPPNVVVANDLQLLEVENVQRDGRPVQSRTPQKPHSRTPRLSVLQRC